MFEIKDVIVIISVMFFLIGHLYLFSIIVNNLSVGDQYFRYFLTGSYLVFYIAFVFPFMYINVYIGIILFWTLTFIIIAYLIFKKTYILGSPTKIKLNFNQKIIIVILIATQILVFYGDALFHISHNFPDTYSNFVWIYGNATNIGDVGYFPGLSVVSILPVISINPLYSLNFFAASVGLVFTVCINLILKPILSFKGLIVFNLILLTPFYYALTYTRVGLNNSQLFPIIFFSIIVFIINKWQDDRYSKYLYGIALSVAGLVTAPHILFLIIPGILIALILTYKLTKKKTIIWLVSLSLSATVFGRVLSTPELIISTRGADPKSINISNSLYVLISDWARVKFPIRSPLESIDSLGAYLIIVIAIWALISSTKKNIKIVKFISILTIVFGITLQTGIGEFTPIKGRIGWYFMWSSALLLSIVFDQTKIQLSKKIRFDNVIGICLILNFMFVIFNLPDHYRKDNESILIQMKKIIAKDNRSELYVYTDIGQLTFVSEKVIVTQNFNSQKIDYFVLNNETQIPDFNLANMRAYEDRNVKKFNDLQLLEINKRLEKNRTIFNYAIRLGYTVVIKDEGYTILSNERY
jgi:hypothetical protein